MATTKKPARTSKKVDMTVDLRRRVIDAALAIIDKHGPDAMSMREVAQLAGVSHQAPYHHFVDRAGIFAAIAAEGFAQLEASLRHSLDTSQEPGIDCLHAYVTFALQHRGHFRVMARSDLCGYLTHPVAHAAADQAFQVLIDLAVRLDPSPKQPEDQLTLPTLLWSHAHGLAMLLIDGPLTQKLGPHVSVNDIIDKSGRLAMRSLPNTPTP